MAMACMASASCAHPRGQAALYRSSASRLPLKGGEEFPVIRIQLLQDGEVSGIDALACGQHLSNKSPRG